VKKFGPFGPGLLVVAAFIGPGTVTTASVAGANFGPALLWAVLFSTLATMVLQEMCARLGIVSRQGLGEALRIIFADSRLRVPVLAFVVVGIGGGNAAFETGNITGAALGLAILTGLPSPLWAVAIGYGACLLLALGVYRYIERVLILLVAGMSLVFVLTAIQARPSVDMMMAGLLLPSLPNGSELLVVALIGTTVVPYNLFLHAKVVQERWGEALSGQQALSEQQALGAARYDTFVSVGLGGVVTLAIVATAAAAFFTQGIHLDSPAQMAGQLEPLLGPAARYFFAFGLLCAGLTSAITAPLAAAYATAGVLGWEQDLKSWRFRAVWASITLIGTLLAALGQRPVAAIILAQAVNGLLLPGMAIFLLIVMNRQELLGEHTNGRVANVCGGVVVFVVSALGFFQLWKAFERLLLV
jgi:manganese transport protein